MKRCDCGCMDWSKEAQADRKQGTKQAGEAQKDKDTKKIIRSFELLN